MKVYLFKIKEGKLKKWREWCRLLMTKYKNEAIETLKEEGITHEAFLIFPINGHYYTVAMIEGETRPTNMERELNQKHKAVKKECLERIEAVEIGYEFYNKS